MGDTSKEYMVTSINEGELGYHDLPLWTEHGVINQNMVTTHIKSLLLSISCPYCKTNVPVSISPNIGTIAISVECSCCKYQIQSTVDSTVKQEKGCVIL